jgi:arsenate reductase
MKKIQIYHNKRCSTSNKALQYLLEKGYNEDDIDVILYLDQPIDKAIATQLAELLKDNLDELIRKPDAKKLGIEVPEKMTKKWVIDAIVKEPKIMQRPIILANGKAVIARPLERIDNVV